MGLLNSTTLDVVIGLVFVYLLLAIICTTVNEWIAGWMGTRAKNLAAAIEQLLDQQKGSDPARSFLQQFYSHPLISGMIGPGNAHPSYLPARTFALTIMDIASPGARGASTLADFEKGLTTDLPDGDVKTVLLALIRNAKGDLNAVQRNIEQWFDDAMDRASGWYKRRVQLVTILIAVLLTVFTNADTTRIAHTLWTSPTLRATLVEKAKSRTESPQSAAEYQDKNNPLKPTLKLKQDEMSALQSVLGWSDENMFDWNKWPRRLIGWILTIVAVSMGAPFWFDMLNKLMNIRNAGKKPVKSDDIAARTDSNQ